MAKEVGSNEEFLKEVELTLLENCWVNGKLLEKGATVTLGGNDKAQLLASKKAEIKVSKK